MMYSACRNTMSNMMSHGASANHAEASFACAHAAYSSMIMMMDAIFMASIIICALLVLVSVLCLDISLLVLVSLLAVLLISVCFPTPRS